MQHLVSFYSVGQSDVQRHIVSLLERYSMSYASNQFRALQQFYKWLSVEEDIPDPMRGLHPPRSTPKAVPVFADGEIGAMIRVCRGRSRRARRDTAILMLFRDTGMRLSELANLAADDVDLHNREAIVTGKGNRQRWVKFTAQTALAIDRYLRGATVPHKAGTRSPMWGLTPNGVYQMVKRRGAQAGVEVHPHRFRHDFAHRWLEHQGSEGDLMQLAGWRSAQMLRRYGASAASSRARAHHPRWLPRAWPADTPR